ncbi:methyltransferase domain containing protein [Nitzschia inconspicua]|uniref:Methyltransferase domain containing protein n=1 Tax=Nitzschia inconspicua TaxID=303405 RepID=A0A9K3KEL0_9STRA|nr:methyltransferase domain containing protein [Nitzschia inconspicua]
MIGRRVIPFLAELSFIILSLLAPSIQGFFIRPSAHCLHSTRESLSRREAANVSEPAATRAPPRTGIAQKVLDMALGSPLWKYLLVPQARAKIVSTAEANQIPWTSAKEWISGEMQTEITADPPLSTTTIPAYYQQSFHAYDKGNLSWEAALEVEIASCAVGARNFPQFGSNGEEAFRGAFDSALIEAGAVVPKAGRILDMGCGTGMSTRRLASNFPQAKAIQGVDLSPYFVAVGKRLLELAPTSFHEGGPWVSNIERDARIEYFVGDASNALQLKEIQEESFDAINLQFVLHELPPEVAILVVDEAFRLLKPSGQLWICEMDFEAPAYAAQRANPLLFSLIRSTEPYLDFYAESISDLFSYVQSKFQHVKVVPATGRHFALVATRRGTGYDGEASFDDQRFDEDGNYRVEDTHLQLWESKGN